MIQLAASVELTGHSATGDQRAESSSAARLLASSCGRSFPIMPLIRPFAISGRGSRNMPGRIGMRTRRPSSREAEGNHHGVVLRTRRLCGGDGPPCARVTIRGVAPPRQTDCAARYRDHRVRTSPAQEDRQRDIWRTEPRTRHKFCTGRDLFRHCARRHRLPTGAAPEADSVEDRHAIWATRSALPRITQHRPCWRARSCRPCARRYRSPYGLTRRTRDVEPGV